MGVPVRIAHAHNRPVGFDLKSVVREYFRFRLPPYATHYFACGQEAGDWLFGVKNRSKVIQERNAVDTALYRYDPTVAEEVRAEFQTPEDCFVLGHVGRFFPQKNHMQLVDIFAAVHKMRPNSRLWLEAVENWTTVSRIKSNPRYMSLVLMRVWSLLVCAPM